jgi:hypothetical protein
VSGDPKRVPVPARAVALPERSQREALLSHARALVTSRAGGDRVRLPMVCSATGRGFVGVVDGVTLQLIGHELPGPGGTGAGADARLLRSFSFAGDVRREWNCPICRQAPGGLEIWACDCRSSSNVLHCGGRCGRRIFCACGQLRDPNFVEVPSLSVTGQTTAAPPARAPAARVLPRAPALLPSPSKALPRSK